MLDLTMKWPASLALLAALLASGYLHGRCAGRWNTASGDAVPVLAAIGRVGEWEGGKTLALDARELAFQTSAEHRVFNHTPSGRFVVLSLTAGRPAAVAVHTPDVCYLGAGYQPMAQARRFSVPTSQGEATLWCCDFQKGGERLRVYWSWTDGHGWQAPDYPRWHFARSPRLAKLYVVHPLTDDDDLTPRADSLIAAVPLLEAVAAGWK